MPQNKKQHYVPRFYLKRFSKDRKSICLYNIKNKIKIDKAKLKSQCYKDYFYGKDLTIENHLGITESLVSDILLEVDRAGILPPPGSPDYLVLILYIIMQYGRTAYSADSLDEMTDKIIKQVYGQIAEAKGIDLSKVNIGLTHATQFSLGLTTQNFPLVLDLHYKLLRNCTGEKLITSDNPVVLYNPFLSFRKGGSNTGFACKGLQIFFPLDSKQIMLLYDSAIYRIGSDKKFVININSNKDIYNLNTLQMCSASENIYFEDYTYNTKALHRKAMPFMRNKKTDLKIFPQYENDSKKSELLMTSREDVRTNLSISFITIRKTAKRWRASFKKKRLQPALIVRNQQLCDDFMKFQDEFKNRNYSPEDFFKFIQDKYGES